MTDTITLHVDPDRLDIGETGYFVRAMLNGKVSSFDISTLTRDSLHAWLRSRGGDNPWAESVVLGMLGHAPIDDSRDGLPEPY